MQDHVDSNAFRPKRRSLLLIGALALVYPLLRFLGYTVPRKPVKTLINQKLPANGILSTKDFILFDRDNKSWALSRKCTHLGCKLSYHEQGNYLECPCHQSRFTVDGTVVKGPAKENLALFPVEKRETAPFYTITS